MNRHLNFRLFLLLLVPTILLGVGVHVLHGVQVRRSAGVLLKQADEAEKRGDPGAAIDKLRRYLTFEQGDAKAVVRLGLLLDRQAKTPAAKLQAFLVLERALRLDPTRRGVRRKVVDIAMSPDLGRYTDAMIHLQELQKATPNNGELEDLFGQCLEGEQRFGEAARAYDRAIQHAPGRVETYARRADLLRSRLDDPDGADRLMDACREGEGVVAKNPGSYRAYLERGLYRRANGIEGDERDIARALELAPGEPDVLLAAAEVAANARDYDAARRHLTEARKRAPDDARLFRALAQVETRAGRDREARAALREGAEAVHDREQKSQLRWGLANLLIDGGRFDEADALIGELRKENVRPELLDYLRARLLAARGQWPQAIAILEVVRPLIAGSTELLYQSELLLAACCERVGDTERRLSAFRRAFDIQPGGLPGRLGLAATLTEMGRSDEALPLYRQLAGQMPGLKAVAARLLIERALNQPEGRRNWGEIDRALAEADAEQPAGAADVTLLRAGALAARGRRDAARDLLTQAIAKSPEDPDLNAALANLAARSSTPGAALAELDAMQRRLGDTVAVRLARANYWAGAGGGKATAALRGLESGLEKFPDRDRQSILRGLVAAHRQIGDLAGTERILDRLIRELPDDLNSRIARFALVLQAGNDAEARRKALGELEATLAKQPPKTLPPLLSLFDLALQAGEEGLADRVLKDLGAIEGEEGAFWRQAEARLLLSRASRADRDPRRAEWLTRARTLLTEAGQRRPNWSLVPLTLADVEQLDGKREVAIRQLQRAKELGARIPALYLGLYRLYVATGRLDLADAQIREMQELGLGGGQTIVPKLMAEVSLRSSRDPAAALAAARKAVPADSKDSRDHLWLAPFLAAAGRAKEAEAELRRAVELGAGEPAPWVALVQFLARSDRRDEALATIREATAEIARDRAPTALAQCYAAVGDADRAARQFDTALAARPDDPVLLRSAAVFALASGRTAEAETRLRQLAGRKDLSPEDAAWAHRTLALVLATGGTAKRDEALTLLGLSGDPAWYQPSAGAPVEELRAQAQVLALQPNPAAKQAAIRALERIIDVEASGTPGDRFLLAQLHEALGQWPRARDRMLRLLADNGDNLLYLDRFARWLLIPGRGRQPDPDAAKPWIDRLERAAPEAIQAAELKARYLAAKDRTGEAIALLRAHVDRHPDRLATVATLAAELGPPAEAEPLYRRLVEQTKQPEAVLLLARFLERQGPARQSEAEEAFRWFVAEAQPQRPQAVLVLAEYFGRRGRLNDALNLCDQAWGTCPPEAVADATLTLLNTGKPDAPQLERAGRALEAAFRKSPGSPNLQFQLGNLRGFQGRYDEAETLYRRSAAQAASNPGPLNNLAWVIALRDPKRASEALKLVNDAIAINGPTPDLLDTRAVVLFQLNRGADAVRDLQEAIASSPAPQAMWYLHLSEAYQLDRKTRKAVDALQKARAAGLTDTIVPPLEKFAYDRLRTALARN